MALRVFQTFLVNKGRFSSFKNGERTRLETSHGCDGREHAVDVDEVIYDRDGDLVYASHISTSVMGKCDGSCEGPKTGYFSILTVEEEVPGVATDPDKIEDLSRWEANYRAQSVADDRLNQQ